MVVTIYVRQSQDVHIKMMYSFDTDRLTNWMVMHSDVPMGLAYSAKRNELAKGNRIVAIIDYCWLLNEALNMLLAISLMGSDHFIIRGGGLEDLFLAGYFFQLMLKLDFFFMHHLKPDFFFYKELKVRFFFKSCLVDSRFCPSVNPIEYFFCNISKQNLFQITGWAKLFFQPKACQIFSKSLPGFPPPPDNEMVAPLDILLKVANTKNTVYPSRAIAILSRIL